VALPIAIIFTWAPTLVVATKSGLARARCLLGHQRLDTIQIYTTIRPQQLKRAVEYYEEKAVRTPSE
jgi:site-specific recombinase XerC